MSVSLRPAWSLQLFSDGSRARVPVSQQCLLWPLDVCLPLPMWISRHGLQAEGRTYTPSNSQKKAPPIGLCKWNLCSKAEPWNRLGYFAMASELQPGSPTTYLTYPIAPFKHPRIALFGLGALCPFRLEAFQLLRAGPRAFGPQPLQLLFAAQQVLPLDRAEGAGLTRAAAPGLWRGCGANVLWAALLESASP